MQLLWENSMNCMMCYCWVLRNTKIVDYLKCIHWFLFVVENLGLKLAVPLSMYLVTDISNGAKGSNIPNTLNLLLPFLSHS